MINSAKLIIGVLFASVCWSCDGDTRLAKNKEEAINLYDRLNKIEHLKFLSAFELQDFEISRLSGWQLRATLIQKKPLEEIDFPPQFWMPLTDEESELIADMSKNKHLDVAYATLVQSSAFIISDPWKVLDSVLPSVISRLPPQFRFAPAYLKAGRAISRSGGFVNLTPQSGHDPI